jgi:hypothetical protein
LSGFSVWKLKKPASPKVPTGRPPQVAPSAWAQSSMTRRSCRPAIAMIALMSHGNPYRCVGTTARVAGVIARSSAAGSMVNVAGSTSANTTFRPATRASSGTTQKVSAGRMISEPRGSSSALRM